MTNKKTDTFSRIVAFITAFAVAMLTVTLIHRTVISAEEALPEMTEASETADGSGESMPSEITSEESVSSDTDNTVSIGETQGDFYEDTAVPPDNGSLEAEPALLDLNAYSDGTDHTTTEGGEISKYKTPVNAASVIIPMENKIKIYNSNKQEIIPDTEVKNGDGLAFDFEWYIPNSNTTDYSKNYFEYDITDSLKGVTLAPRTYSYWKDNQILAVYEIVNETDPLTNKIRTKMLIEPRFGFEADSKDKGGAVHLYGSVNLDEFPAGEPNVTLRFFNATANVKAPSLDNSIKPEKWCIGSPEKRVENGVINYYQKYQINLYNQSSFAADGVTALDIPGSLFVGEPQNVLMWYGYDSTGKTASQAVPNPDGNGYIFSAGSIPAGDVAHIEYEMQIDTGKAVNPSITGDDRTNTVIVNSNKYPDASPATAAIDVSSIKPYVNKSGVLDKENNKIIWTITIHSNGLSDKDFTVKDIIDSSLTIPGYSGSWSKADFEDKGDGVWEKSYETEIPADVTNNKSYNNKAEVKFADTDITYSGEGSVTYRYDVENFVSKECTGLNADKTIGWTITADVPEHLNSGVKSIVIKDEEDLSGISKYDGQTWWNPFLKYNTGNITVQADNGAERPAAEVGQIDFIVGWSDYLGDNVPKGFTLTVNNTDFLKDIAGKKITVKYTTEIYEKYDPAKVNLCHNGVTCTVKYDKDSLDGSGFAEYIGESEPEEPFTLEKGLGQNTWYDASGNIDDTGKLREYISWSFTISNIKNLNPKTENTITFTDKAPAGYTFDTRVDGTSFPKYYMFAEISDTYDESFKPRILEFNSDYDYTEMTGEIKLTAAQSEDIVKNNRSIKVHYFTQMTKEKQREFLAKGESESFTNTVSVTVGDKKRETTYTKEVSPDTNKIIQKISGDVSGHIVDYTINVNSNSLHLGSEDVKEFTLTDTFGKYLKFNGGLTVNGMENYPYEENGNQIKLTLKNDTAYTIKYKANVVTSLGPMEYDDSDGIDDDRDKDIIDMLYGNTAVLSFPDGNSAQAHKLIGAEIYRSDVSISSRLSNEFDAGDTILLKIKKQWDDTDNPQAKNGPIVHDESISVKLNKYYFDNLVTPLKQEDVKIDVHMYNNEYYKIVKGLPIKDNNGKSYVYKVVGEENLPKNYVLDEVSDMEPASGSDVIKGYNTYVITITNKYKDDTEKMKLTVKKEWEGENGNTKNRGDSVGFTIMQGEKIYMNGTLNAKDDWEKTFDVPKYSDNVEKTPYVYTVSETTDSQYYKHSVASKADSDGKGMTYTITNTYIPQINLTVEKAWKKDDGYTDLRSGSVEFSITRNGDEYKTVTLNDLNGWKQTLTVPTYSNDGNNTPYEYNVTETTKNPYYASSTADTTDGNNRTVTVTNTYIPRKQINLTVKKAWEKDDGYTGLRSDSVDILITRDGNDYKTVTLNAENGWEQTLTVPQCSDAEQTKNFKYAVKEKTANKNYISSIPKEPSENADGSIAFTVTNTFDPVDITVKKIWDDSGNEDKRKDVKFTLMQENNVYGTYTISGNKEDNEWTYTVKNVPKYDKNGKRYAYAVMEDIEDYTISKLINPNKDNNYNASITNKYSTDIDLNEKITVTVTKHWSDEGHENNRKDVTFVLTRNDDSFRKTYTIEMLGKTGDNWKYEIDDLPKYNEKGEHYVYTIEEVSVPGYSTKIMQNPAEGNGYNAIITNVYNPPETIDISVTKTWDDGDYKYMRPDIILKLMQGNTEYDRYTIHAADNVTNNTWTYTFKNVPECDKDGNPYSYSVKEEIADEKAAESYDVSILQSGNSWSITNKYKVPHESEPETTEPTPTVTTSPEEEPEVTTPPKTEPPVTTPPETEPTVTASPVTEPTGTAPPVTDPVNPTLPVTTEPTVTTAPMADGIVIPIWGSTTSTSSEEPDPTAEPEDVSAKAGIFDDEFDAVRRDDIIILVLTVIIITGTLILVFRHNSNKSDGKYRM